MQAQWLFRTTKTLARRRFSESVSRIGWDEGHIVATVGRQLKKANEVRNGFEALDSLRDIQGAGYTPSSEM